MAERSKYYERHVLDGYLPPEKTVAQEQTSSPEIAREELIRRALYQMALEDPHPLDPEYNV